MFYMVTQHISRLKLFVYYFGMSIVFRNFYEVSVWKEMRYARLFSILSYSRDYFSKGCWYELDEREWESAKQEL